MRGLSSRRVTRKDIERLQAAAKDFIKTEDTIRRKTLKKTTQKTQMFSSFSEAVEKQKDVPVSPAPLTAVARKYVVKNEGGTGSENKEMPRSGPSSPRQD